MIRGESETLPYHTSRGELKLSPNVGESFRGELFNMKEL